MSNASTFDVARRAERIYSDRLHVLLEPLHLHEFVAIEPESGDYFLGQTLSEAVQTARISYPDRLVFAMRVGYSAAVHLGVLAAK